MHNYTEIWPNKIYCNFFKKLITYVHSRSSRGLGYNYPLRSQKFGKNQNVSGSDKAIFEKNQIVAGNDRKSANPEHRGFF